MRFDRPSRSTMPDFLTSLTNPAERVIRARYHDQVPRTPDEFAIAWRQSDLAKSPHALGWFRYVNPVAFTYESVMINEPRGRQFSCSNKFPDGPEYSSVNESLKLCSGIARDASSGSVDGTAHLALQYGYSQDHLWRNLGILFAMMVFFCTVHLLAAEHIPADRSRGEVLFFKRSKTSQIRKTQVTQDDETRIISSFTHDATVRSRCQCQSEAISIPLEWCHL